MFDESPYDGSSVRHGTTVERSRMTSTSASTPRTPPPRVTVPGRSPLPHNGHPKHGDAKNLHGDDLDLTEQSEKTPNIEGGGEGPNRRFRPSLALLWLSAIGLGALLAFFLFGRDETLRPDEVELAIDEALTDAFDATTLPPDRGPAIYGTVFPSLVLIQVGDGEDGGLGSGVIINADGSIMTSDHVVTGGGPITVTFTDGTTATGQVTESVPEMDIAIVQTDVLPDVVVPATFGGTPAIGSRVYAVGNPLGLSASISTGVVSATGRVITRDEGEPLEDLIQFDAAVNPGSSGGPLLDENAQLIGIVTALANPTGEDFFSGIGFAVPIQNAAGQTGGPEQ